MTLFLFLDSGVMSEDSGRVQPSNQITLFNHTFCPSNFSIKKLFLKVVDTILFTSFSLLTIFFLLDNYVEFVLFVKLVSSNQVSKSPRGGVDTMY